MVATQTRTKRDGKYLDLIGYYNPSQTPAAFDYDKKKYQDWISKGAIVSDAVKKMVEGKYEYTKYRPGKEEAAEKGSDKEAVQEKPAAEETAPAAEETPEQA